MRNDKERLTCPGAEERWREMMRHTILLVDDDAALLDALSAALEWPGYDSIKVQSGEEALGVLDRSRVDLIVLDLVLPGMGGQETLERIRESSDVPIIILTGSGTESSVARLLHLGADDYVEKPFRTQELLARIEAVLRRAVRAERTLKKMTVGDLEVDMTTRQVTLSGTPVMLTNVEWELLSCLVQHCGEPLTHRVLLEHVWGPDYAQQRELLHTHVTNLRRKLGDSVQEPKYIQTLYGVGYRFLPASQPWRINT